MLEENSWGKLIFVVHLWALPQHVPTFMWYLNLPTYSFCNVRKARGSKSGPAYQGLLPAKTLEEITCLRIWESQMRAWVEPQTEANSILKHRQGIKNFPEISKWNGPEQEWWECTWSEGELCAGREEGNTNQDNFLKVFSTVLFNS